MAAQQSDDDENYWPGYVDALTTMTMVLTFIMMVLGVMVFILSQETIAAKFGTLARALKIETKQIEKLTDAELEEAIRRALAMRDTGPGVSVDGEGGPRRGAAGPVAEPAEDRVEPGPGEGRIDPAKLTPTEPVPNSNRNPQKAEAPPQVTTFKGGLVGEEAAGPGGEYHVRERTAGVSGEQDGVGGRQEPGPGSLRFVFEKGAIDLPTAVAEALQAYVAIEGQGPLVVEATAVPHEGSVTEARRKAYFRAMLIRARLIKLGVQPIRIAVRVRDATQVSTLETVDVSKPKGGG